MNILIPQLKPPHQALVWAVVSNHPYYPNIEFFATEDEAIVHAKNEIKALHDEEGPHDESSVSVLKVQSIASIKTCY